MRTLGPLVLAACVAQAGAVFGPEAQAEYTLKAQILLGLLPYVQWPAAAPAPHDTFVLGVLGRSPFGSFLDTYARARTIQRRPIEIRYGNRPEDLEGCEAVFICPSETRKLGPVLAWAKARRILTLADSRQAAEQGVMVILLLEGEYVRLLVNLDLAQAQGFAFGSLLLRNAQILGSASKGH